MSKPWENEPHPQTDALCKKWCHNETDQLTTCIEHAEQTEQRLRHAEMLLDEWPGSFATERILAQWCAKCRAHLAVAKEADNE